MVAIAIFLSMGSGRAMAQGWPALGRDPQHSGQAPRASQLPQHVRWKTQVDLSLPADATRPGAIYIHYGSPVITRMNTVLVPVKTTVAGDFRVEARHATDGSLVWSHTSDYVLPAHDWVPVFGITLTPKDRFLVYPGAGGTVFVRTFPDSSAGGTYRFAFYNTPTTNYYAESPTSFNDAIQICTPISSDSLGNVYFGFVSNGLALPGYPNGIPSGLARISNTGVGSFVSAASMSGDPNMKKVVTNCSPSFSGDGTTLYVAVNTRNFGQGYLCALNSLTLARKSSVFLRDPRTNLNAAAAVSDDGSGTPTVGPDGDVYFGVLEASFPSNHARGYLLHFDGTLTTTKIPSAFGWDDTASVVPASAVASYTGSSSYLLLTKYNNYADPGIGGDGLNRLAIVDPTASMTDPISGATVMKTVITVLGVTPNTELNKGVREWCINSAAIDVVNKCAVVNSEDGKVYRWDFTSNTLSPGLMLEPPTGEAYTPTAIGPDGAIYAINNASLFCCSGP